MDAAQHFEQHPSRPSRKGKERDLSPRDAPQATDIFQRITALQRKQAEITRTKERVEREKREHQLLSTQQPQNSQLASTNPRTQPAPPRNDLSPKPPAVPSRSPASTRRHPSPLVVISKPTGDSEIERFSQLKIASSSSSTTPTPRPPPSNKSKLYNPNVDPIPMRRTAEPEPMIDVDPSHVPSRAYPHHIRSGATTGPRQLFDPRKDDPVQFHIQARPPAPAPPQQQQQQQHQQQIRPNHKPTTPKTPTPRSSGDYVYASSTSSYAASVSSSTFTLSSTTDTSSASSALFDGRPGQTGTDPSNANVFSQQLKKLYRGITTLEAKIQKEDAEDAEDMGSRIMLKSKETSKDDLEREKWAARIKDHKSLAEIIHNLLQISLAPSVPVSLKNIPTKYNIIVRLWTFAFHRLLESLRRASLSSDLALEHLQDFIYYAYTFYTSLLEESALEDFRSGWLEALGDLARYRMALAAILNASVKGGEKLTTSAVDAANEVNKGLDVPVSGTANGNSSGKKSISILPEGRIGSQPPSVGVAAAKLLEVEPEKERWRNIARDWYATGLFEQPGAGKLHHHLGLLSHEVECEELRCVYHFVKSMTTLHPFMKSRESVLPIWSTAAQMRRMNPDARVSELFVLLHGMLFTNIQLDDFQPTLARFLERLVIEGAEEREWIMMAVINIASMLEYGKPTGVLKRAGVVGTRDPTAMRTIAKKTNALPEENGMDIDNEQQQRNADEHMSSPTTAKAFPNTSSSPFMPSAAEGPLPESPLSFKLALQLTFAMLTYVLRNPTRKATPYARSTLNPYLTVLLTFLSTVLKQPRALEIFERSVPWEHMAAFFASIPRKVMEMQALLPVSSSSPSLTPMIMQPQPEPTERWSLLTSGCKPPLPEDWCLRGMEWLGRRVYERGYWKRAEGRPEVEVLERDESLQVTDGHIEDDGEEGNGHDHHGGSGAARMVNSDSASRNHNRSRETVNRWIRIVRSAVDIAGAVDGFTWVNGTREWKVEGRLAEKVQAWREMDRLEREEEERRRMGRRWVDDDDSMDVDEEEEEGEEESEESENDTEEVRELKARRRYLRSLLQSAQHTQLQPQPQLPIRSRATTRSARRKTRDGRPSLRIVPGYTVLVVDTNILLSSLSMITSLIESLRWTILIPLPVIMELDGLVNNTSQLGKAAESAMGYIQSHLRSHSISLKVQTSKGNYLTSLNVRTEEVDFAPGNFERCMDDLILKAAIWHDEHWVDRSALLNVSTQETTGAVKVVLLSLDRNLRLKARSRRLPAAGEKDLAVLLAKPV